MIRSLYRNICSLGLLIVPGVAMALPIPVSPMYDATLTDWQQNLTNGQASFDLAGPGISLHATAIDPDVSYNGLFYVVLYDPQPFRISLDLFGFNDALAQGTVNGVTYTAANPLALDMGGLGIATTLFSFPSSGPPDYTFNTDPLLTFPVVSEPTSFYGCTPLCNDITDVLFGLNVTASAGTASVQFSGPVGGIQAGPATTFYPGSFSFQASPVPEPAVYGSFVLGLISLYSFAQFKRRGDRRKSER